MDPTGDKIMSRALDPTPALILDPPRFIPCPHPGLPGAQLRDGSCRYLAELMPGLVWFWRCPIHGTIRMYRP
jgi:hypothetical protein